MFEFTATQAQIISVVQGKFNEALDESRLTRLEKFEARVQLMQSLAALFEHDPNFANLPENQEVKLEFDADGQLIDPEELYRNTPTPIFFVSLTRTPDNTITVKTNTARQQHLSVPVKHSERKISKDSMLKSFDDYFRNQRNATGQTDCECYAIMAEVSRIFDEAHSHFRGIRPTLDTTLNAIRIESQSLASTTRISLDRFKGLISSQLTLLLNLRGQLRTDLESLLPAEPGATRNHYQNQLSQSAHALMILVPEATKQRIHESLERLPKTIVQLMTDTDSESFIGDTTAQEVRQHSPIPPIRIARNHILSWPEEPAENGSNRRTIISSAEKAREIPSDELIDIYVKQLRSAYIAYQHALAQCDYLIQCFQALLHLEEQNIRSFLINTKRSMVLLHEACEKSKADYDKNRHKQQTNVESLMKSSEQCGIEQLPQLHGVLKQALAAFNESTSMDLNRSMNLIKALADYQLHWQQHAKAIKALRKSANTNLEKLTRSRTLINGPETITTENIEKSLATAIADLDRQLQEHDQEVQKSERTHDSAINQAKQNPVRRKRLNEERQFERQSEALKRQDLEGRKQRYRHLMNLAQLFATEYCTSHLGEAQTTLSQQIAALESLLVNSELDLELLTQARQAFIEKYSENDYQSEMQQRGVDLSIIAKATKSKTKDPSSNSRAFQPAPLGTGYPSSSAASSSSAGPSQPRKVVKDKGFKK